MFQNPSAANNAVLEGVAGNNPTTQQQNINYNGMQQQQQTRPPPPQQQQQQQPQQQPQQSQPAINANRAMRKKPYIKITEQPAGKALRFRYECEGRSAGSIPGVNSTTENKTYPSIEIVGYKGRAVVVVSCVTKDPPYRPHPHNLVGKEGCKKGVCTMEVNSETMRVVFSNLGIQCVKKKDIEAALKSREEIRVDPFKTGFSHRFQPSSIDLNSVRLCFQVFMESTDKGRFTQALTPVVSDPIFDKKAMSDLVICRLCSCSASVLGSSQIILLCEKVAKEDISVRFYEEKNGQVIWEALGEFQHTDVHKQTAITFKTPRYRTLDITQPAKVWIQLRRPSDGVTSEPLPFEYVPLDSGRHTFWNLRRNLKRKPDLDIFQQILAVDSEVKPVEVIDLNTPTNEVPDKQVFSSTIDTVVPPQGQVPEDAEAAKRRSEHEIDTIIDEKVRELEQQEIQQQQLQQQQLQEQQQQQQHEQEQQQLVQAENVVQPIENHLAQNSVEAGELTANEKINEWMNSNELERMDSTSTGDTIVASNDNANTNNNNDNNNLIATLPPPSAIDDDKTLNDLLEQVAELDEIYTDHMLRRDTYNNTILNELSGMETCVPDEKDVVADGSQTAMDVDDNFDDTATYTSLQLAFKNPIPIQMDDIMPPTPPASNLAPEDAQHYDPIEVMSYPVAQPVNTNENVMPPSEAQTPPRPAPPKFSSPIMHVTAAEEEKLPPLPPKRIRKQDSNAENRSIEANTSESKHERKSRQQTPIIIMKTPDHSPPTKRLPPKPGGGNSNTLPKQKKPGFFSKLFSRRKSKSDLSPDSEQGSILGSRQGSKHGTPTSSREPSIGHFQMNDPNRSSIRSVKSLQPSSLPNSPERKAEKIGKPVGRSVSSVSGKRPAHLNADVIHIPLKGDSVNSLPYNEAYSNSSTVTLGNTLDRRTVSALQLADIPISDGNMELVAITDRQSLRNLCEGEFNVQLDPDVDLTEAEHYALYTSIPPQATASEFDEASAYYAAVDAGEILTPDEIARRLTEANRIN